MSAGVIHALVPAAGKGARFGGSTPKQYVELAGKPVLAHAIDSLVRHARISRVTAVIAANDRKFSRVVGSGREWVDTVTGGQTRAESVMNGLRSIRRNHPDTEWVLVHDAARPCLPEVCLERLLETGLQNRDGAILAVPVRDTLKRSNEAGLISATVERKKLWAAQTPQLFPLENLIMALGKCLGSDDPPTDEAGAMEAAGARPKLVMGSTANIKITWPDDIAIAEAWLFASLTGREAPRGGHG